MPDAKRARHARMKLRHGPAVANLVGTLYPKVTNLLTEIADSHRSSATASEVRAAAKHLSRTLAEFTMRKKTGVQDRQYDSLDEVLWREDRALQGDWEAVTGFPNGSQQQEMLKQQIGEVSAERIAAARSLREAIQKDAADLPIREGGARHSLANALRHAWLICHDGHAHISYGRQTDACGDHAGPLHRFIRSVLELAGKHVSPSQVDGFHRVVRDIDKRLHPNPSGKVP